MSYDLDRDRPATAMDLRVGFDHDSNAAVAADDDRKHLVEATDALPLMRRPDLLLALARYEEFEAVRPRRRK